MKEIYYHTHGLKHLNLLVKYGLKPELKLLDFGYGYWRTAIPVIKHLQKNNYLSLELSKKRLTRAIEWTKNLLGSVMLSAPNIIVVYDIKHQYENLKNIYSIDHLDPYSDRTTYHDFSLNAFLKNYTRKIFSYLNIRYD